MSVLKTVFIEVSSGHIGNNRKRIKLNSINRLVEPIMIEIIEKIFIGVVVEHAKSNPTIVWTCF